MKKLMFAFACAASVCALADGDGTGSWINFEGMAPNATGLGTLNDSGVDATPRYFSYESASGSTDGSIVKKYGGTADNIAESYGGKRAAKFMSDQTQDYYLELSTEGGTLWRNFTTSGDIGGDDAGGFKGEYTLGDAVQLKDLAQQETPSTVYVDTLVQFTPTEDGTAPTVSDQDQMAIWLNVDSTNPDAPVTNLCVLAARLITDSGMGTKTTFKVTNADVVPGQWYRLTVKTIADITSGVSYPGFMVYLDGKLLKTDTPTTDEDAFGVLESWLTVPAQAIADGSVFVSLWTTVDGQTPSVPTFTAVGFKGSGAIDDLIVSTEEPNIFEAVTSLDFTLTWDANVSAITYTLDGGAAQPVAAFVAGTAGSAKIEGVEPGAVVAVQATPAEWFTATVTGAGEITTADQTVAVTTTLATTPELAGAGKLAGVKTADAQAWAAGKGLKIADIQDCDFAKNAYLMNTDLSAEPGLAITSITEVEDGWQITVKGTQGENAVTLKGINGQLNIKAAATLEGLATAEATPVTLTDADFDEAGVATIKVAGDNKNFMKATVGVKATTAE